MEQNLFNKLQKNFKTFIETPSRPPTQPSIEPPKVFTFNSSHIGRKLSDIAQDIKIKSMICSGMPKKIIKKSIRGKRWGWEVTVKKITDYEKTSIFGYGDDGIGYRIIFTDKLGNDFMSIINTTTKMKEEDKYAIDGTLTKLDPILRLVRVKIIKDLQHPESSPS